MERQKTKEHEYPQQSQIELKLEVIKDITFPDFTLYYKAAWCSFKNSMLLQLKDT